MTFNSTHRVPYIRTYEEAKKRHDMTTPIRGDKNKTRPLAKRSDKHLYIRERIADGVVLYECCCYSGENGTVVTYHPNDEVQISVGRYNTAYVREFVVELLSDIHVYTSKGKTVVQLRDGKDKYVLGANEFRIKRDKSGLIPVWTVVQAEGALEWRLSKAKANIVRAPYTEFLKYYKGMTSILTEHIDFDVRYANQRWNKPTAETPFVAKTEVVVHMETVVNMFGQTVHVFGGTPTVDTTEPRKALFTHLRTWGAEKERDMQNAREKADKLEVLALMRNDQPDEVKGENFYRAALTLLVAQQTHIATKAEFFRISRSSAEKLADEFVLRVFKEEVLEQVRMPVGKVASTNYADWFKFV